MIQRTGNIKLDDMMKRRKHRAIEHEWEDIFADHDICQQYYTMSLIGEHIHRLLKHCDDICSRIEDVILRHFALSPAPKNHRGQSAAIYGTCVRADEVIGFLEFCDVPNGKAR
jgi:hypothetical protein